MAVMASVGTAISALSRRRFLSGAAAWSALATLSGLAGSRKRDPKSLLHSIRDTFDQAVPPGGVHMPFGFGDTIQRLVLAGAIDPGKFRARSGKTGKPVGWVDDLLAAPARRPIFFSTETAPFLVDLLWPIGLANKVPFNDASPLNDRNLPSYASTGGWTLGRAKNGAAYFNTVRALALSNEQQGLALEIAKTTFRPCCDNATYFQDCNHGSALLGLIELAAYHGFSAREIYRSALVANSYWFPMQYIQAALYFLIFESRSWSEIQPELILGRRYSTLSGWASNIVVPLRAANLLPPSAPSGTARCGI